MFAVTQKIHDFVREEHPDVWRDVCENALHLVHMKLFGIIPCGKFVQHGNKRKGILKYLPFVTTRMKLEIK